MKGRFLSALPTPEMRRALRCGCRLTLAQAATEIGTSTSSMHYYERDRVPRPGSTLARYEQLLERLAVQLGLDQR
jgi:hypothetical protein